MNGLDGNVFQRYEYKYVIPASLMAPIRAFIRPYCELDSFAGREPQKFYTIRTLYLDSPGYRTYWDKQHEVPVRFKLRIRTYGDGGGGPVKFEIKRRINEVVRKTWLGVPPETWPALLAGPASRLTPDLNQAERATLDDFIRLSRTLNAGPRMLVRYQRQAYTSAIDRYVRITFDRHLCHQPAHGYDLMGQPAMWRYDDDSESLGSFGPQVVLELKFMTRAPLWLAGLTRAFGLTRRGFSKYCTAVSRNWNAARTGRELAQAIAMAA